MPTHWTSKAPKRHQRNAANDLNRSYQISMYFDHDKGTTREKYRWTDFPIRVVNNVIRQFHQKLINKQTDYELKILTFYLQNPRNLVQILFCVSNGNTENIFKQIVIFCLIFDIRSLLRLKDKNLHPASKICEGSCSCSAKYFGETKRSVEKRWNEHENPNKETLLIINSIERYLPTNTKLKIWNHQ